MYNKAKGAESERKKHNQILSKMQDDLTFLKRENARRLKVIKRGREGGNLKDRGEGGRRRERKKREIEIERERYRKCRGGFRDGSTLFVRTSPPPPSKYLKYFFYLLEFHGSLPDDLQIDSFFSAQVNSYIQYITVAMENNFLLTLCC